MVKRRAIQRFVIRASIFLLLGVIVNIAIAWACSWRASGWPTSVSPSAAPATTAATSNGFIVLPNFEYVPPPLHPKWLEPAGRAHNLQFVERVESDFGSHIHQFAILDGELHSYREYEYDVYPIMHDERVGWPMLSLQCSGRVDVDASSMLTIKPVIASWRTGIAVPKSWSRRDAPYFGSASYQRPIPFGPIWPGFAINTIFYAVLLWLLIACVLAVRSQRRLRRGLCRTCAYPIGESSVCTECGRPLPGADLSHDDGRWREDETESGRVSLPRARRVRYAQGWRRLIRVFLQDTSDPASAGRLIVTHHFVWGSGD